MPYLLIIVAVSIALFLVERHEVQLRTRRNMARRAKQETIRMVMDLHPIDRVGRVPDGWR